MDILFGRRTRCCPEGRRRLGAGSPLWTASLWLRLAVSLAAAAAPVGCAAIRSNEVLETERVLEASGFKRKFADSAEQRIHLRTLVQHQLVFDSEEGAARYVYADAEHCRCVYVGDEAAYQRYRELAFTEQTTRDRRKIEARAAGTRMNWGVWGGLNSWF